MVALQHAAWMTAERADPGMRADHAVCGIPGRPLQQQAGQVLNCACSSSSTRACQQPNEQGSLQAGAHCCTQDPAGALGDRAGRLRPAQPSGILHRHPWQQVQRHDPLHNLPANARHQLQCSRMLSRLKLPAAVETEQAVEAAPAVQVRRPADRHQAVWGAAHDVRHGAAQCTRVG